MSRLEEIKNLSSMMKWYVRSEEVDHLQWLIDRVEKLERELAIIAGATNGEMIETSFEQLREYEGRRRSSAQRVLEEDGWVFK